MGSENDESEELSRLRSTLQAAQQENASLKQQLARTQLYMQEPDDDNNKYRAPPKTLLLLDLLDGDIEVEEERLMDVMRAADKEDQAFMCYKYSELQDGESLQEHVIRQASSDSCCPGPHQEETLIYMSQRYMTGSQFPNFEMAKKLLAKWWQGSSWRFWREGQDNNGQFKHSQLHQSQEWNSHIKNIMAGNFHPYGVLCLNPSGRPGVETQAIHMISSPIVIKSGVKRFWGHLRETALLKRVDYHDTFLRITHQVKSTPVCITVINSETGVVIKQNLTSTAMFGNHGVYDQVKLKDGNEKKRQALQSARQPLLDSASEEGLSFLELLFFDQGDEIAKLRASQVSGTLFSTRIEIKSRRLRSWMQLAEDEAAFHDVHAMVLRDPITLEPVYILTNIDVTDTVLAQKAVLKANEELADEKVRMDALLRRQYELIEVLQAMPMSNSRGKADNEVADKIKMLHQELQEAGAVSPAEADDIKLLSILGRGQFGTVYLGEWRGAVVAVKRILLPAVMSNSERAQKMAVMEIAISSSMNHPNLVQTYTYSIKQVRDETEGLKVANKSGLNLHAHEMRLVLEYCDRGSLQAYVRHYQGIRDEGGTLLLANLIETAADIARGMLHLHKNNILHNDLKTANVLIKNEGCDGRGVKAKVMDFGLSIKLDNTATHLSNAFQGTMSHMAPEALSEGKQSKAADVYSFGITLWELCSGLSPYKGLNHVGLSQQVVMKHKRPTMPKDVPADLQILIERCWQPLPSHRPNFEVILEELHKIRVIMGGEARPWSQSVPGDLSSENLQIINSTSGGGNQGGDGLTEALFVSQVSFISMEGWTPVIMEGPPEGEAKSSSRVEVGEARSSLPDERKALSSPPEPVSNGEAKLSLDDLLRAKHSSNESLRKISDSGSMPPAGIKIMISSHTPDVPGAGVAAASTWTSTSTSTPTVSQTSIPSKRKGVRDIQPVSPSPPLSPGKVNLETLLASKSSSNMSLRKISSESRTDTAPDEAQFVDAAEGFERVAPPSFADMVQIGARELSFGTQTPVITNPLRVRSCSETSESPLLSQTLIPLGKRSSLPTLGLTRATTGSFSPRLNSTAEEPATPSPDANASPIAKKGRSSLKKTMGRIFSFGTRTSQPKPHQES